MPVLGVQQFPRRPGQPPERITAQTLAQRVPRAFESGLVRRK
jgi:hypothetical protein